MADERPKSKLHEEIDQILATEDLHCACHGPVLGATEPHWREPGGV